MIESKQELLQRISVNPAVCFGKPCVKGHRIWVSLILDMLADGVSYEEVLENYPRMHGRAMSTVTGRRNVTCE